MQLKFKLLLLLLPLAIIIGLFTVPAFADTGSGSSTPPAPTVVVQSAPAQTTGERAMSNTEVAVFTVLVFLGFLSTIGHVIAPRTKTLWDDRQVARIDALEGKIKDFFGGLEVTTLKPIVDETTHSPPPPTSKPGFASAWMLASLALLGVVMAAMLSSGCAALKSDVKSVASSVVTCAKADQSKAQALGLQLAMQAVTSLILNGHADWKTIADTAESGAESQGLDVAACAFKSTVDKIDALLASAQQGSGSAVPQGLIPQPPPGDSGGRAALAAFNANHGIAAIQ